MRSEVTRWQDHRLICRECRFHVDPQCEVGKRLLDELLPLHPPAPPVEPRVYPGQWVTFCPSRRERKWKAEIANPETHTRVYAGFYDSEEEARQACARMSFFTNAL